MGKEEVCLFTYVLKSNVIVGPSLIFSVGLQVNFQFVYSYP